LKNKFIVILIIFSLFIISIGHTWYRRVFATSPHHSVLYIAESSSNTVNAVDTLTKSVTATIRVGENPINLTLSPSGNSLYVSFNNGTDIIDTSTNTRSASISSIGPVVISPDGAKAYFSNGDVINTSNNQLITTINIPSCTNNAMAKNSSGTKLYVMCGYNYDVIDIVTNQIIYTSPNFAGALRGMALSPDGTKLYFTSESPAQLFVFDTSNNSQLRLISLPYNLTSIILKSDGSRAYLLAGGEVDVMDLTTYNIIAKIRTCESSLYTYTSQQTIDPLTNSLYVACDISNSISKIDIASNTEAEFFSSEFGPVGIVFKP